MKINPIGHLVKTNPIQTQFLQRPKMSATVFVTKDYENETNFRPKKTNPNKANFTYPQRLALSYAEGAKTEVRCRMSEVRYLSSVHGHLLVKRMKPKLLNFHLKIRKKPEKPQFPPNF